MLELLEKLGIGEVEEWDWDLEGSHWPCYRVYCENGYGASIVKHPGSYGFEQDLWELGVIWWDKDSRPDGEQWWWLTYDTPITDDVIGHLSDDEVLDICKKIAELDEGKTFDWAAERGFDDAEEDEQ